jgi:NADPH2:quinone reductase
MRAWRVHTRGEPRDVLRLDDIDVPAPGVDQVRIEVEAAALNFADYLLCHGNYQLSPAPPFTPGMEVTGRVVEAGGACGELEGARVIAVTALPAGGLADHTLADAMNVYRVPEALDGIQAAGILIPFQTGHIALHRRARLRPGETLLVHAAAGGVGSAALQMGVAAGARVFATAGGAKKLALCRELGAELAIDYREEDFVEKVMEATGGRGVDVIYESVGGDVFERSRKCMASEGRLLIIGYTSGLPGKISSASAMLRNYDVIGVYMGAYPATQRDVLDWHHEEILGLFASGRVRSVVDDVIEFEDVPQAIANLASRKTIGKLVVRL